MKYILLCLTLYAFIVTSCKVQNSNNMNFDGKSYTHTYLYSSMANEYGKGGGMKFFKLVFDKEEVKFSQISQTSLPDKDGKQAVKQDIIYTFTSPYKVKDKLITVDSKILSQLKIKNDTLIAPQINIEEKLPQYVTKDVVFTLSN